jgi:hypothetical protein
LSIGLIFAVNIAAHFGILVFAETVEALFAIFIFAEFIATDQVLEVCILAVETLFSESVLTGFVATQNFILIFTSAILANFLVRV